MKTIKVRYGSHQVGNDMHNCVDLDELLELIDEPVYHMNINMFKEWLKARIKGN